MKKAQKTKQAKLALQERGFKSLICHDGRYVTAKGWQLNTRLWGRADRYGNGRYVVAEYCGHFEKWMDVHGNEI